MFGGSVTRLLLLKVERKQKLHRIKLFTGYVLHIFSIISFPKIPLFALLPRIRLPSLPGRDFCPGLDRRLHGGGRQALPVCVQSHHQRQTSKWQIIFILLSWRVSMLIFVNTLQTKSTVEANETCYCTNAKLLTQGTITIHPLRTQNVYAMAVVY